MSKLQNIARMENWALFTLQGSIGTLRHLKSQLESNEEIDNQIYRTIGELQLLRDIIRRNQKERRTNGCNCIRK